MATSTEKHVPQKRRRENVEITFAQRLAGNEKKTRDRAIKKLNQWISARSKKSGAFSEEELMKLWKGLFYCMWMSDKPLVQEELAAKIADLTHSFATGEAALGYFDTCLLTIKREWAGIDYLRIDKFMMMVRKCLAAALVVLKQRDWQESLVDMFLQILVKTPLNLDAWACPDGLRIHISDIFREELGKIGADQLTKEQVNKFVDPFCILVTTTKSKSLSQVMLQEFFGEIVTQSEVGMEESSDSEDEGIQSGGEAQGDDAPTKGDKKEEKGYHKEEDEEERDKDKDENKQKDVVEEKAGEEFIDKWEEHLAEIPQLQYDYAAIADRLLQLAGKKDTLHQVRRNVYVMVKKLRDLAAGFYPMPDLEELQEDVEKVEKQVEREIDPELREKIRHQNKKKRNRRKRKKKSSESEANSVEDGKTNDHDEEKDEGDHTRKQTLKQTQKRTDDSSPDKNQKASVSDKKVIEGRAGEVASEKARKKRKRRRKQKQQQQVNGESQTAKLQGGVVKEDGPSQAKVSKLDEGFPEQVKSKGKDSQESREKMDVLASNEMIERDSNVAVASNDNVELEIASPSRSSKKRKNKSKVDHSENGVTTSSKGDVQSEDSLLKSPLDSSIKVGLKVAEDNTTATDEDASEKNESSDLPPSSSSSKKRRKSKELQDEELSTPKMSPEDTVPGQDEVVQKEVTPVEREVTPISKRTRRKSAMKQAKLQEVDNDENANEVSTPVTQKTRRSKRQSVLDTRKGKVKATLPSVDSADAVTPGSSRKRVKIALSQNEVRAPKDYRKRVQSSPGIPFDSTKKPTQPALKFTPPTTRARAKAMSAKKTR